MQPVYKRPTKGNPYNITVRQHVHSKHLIKKFANAGEHVTAVTLQNGSVRQVKPTDAIFCAHRAWDEKAERATCGQIEVEYFLQVKGILENESNYAVDHKKVTEYYCLWNVRQLLSVTPQVDVHIRGKYTPSRILTNRQREHLEKNGVVTMTNFGALEARFLNGVNLRLNIDREAQRMKDVKWGILKAPVNAEFICADAYPNFEFMPISPDLALIGTGENAKLKFEDVASLNRMSKENARIFYFARNLSLAPILKSNFI